MLRVLEKVTAFRGSDFLNLYIIYNLSSLSCRLLFPLVIVILVLSELATAAVELHVTVQGLDGPLYKNVMARLSINLQKDNERLQPAAISRLHRLAEEDIRSSLAPFGYYNPLISSFLEQRGDAYYAEYTVQQGMPVIVEKVDVQIIGSGKTNKKLLEALTLFPLKKGDILDQAVYEREKKKLIITAYAEGFLEAGFTSRALRIDRKNNVGSIELVIDTGRPFVFGEIVTDQKILEPTLLRKYLPFAAGDPYSTAKLFELQSILYRTEYFSRVAVRGQVDKAEKQAVPVKIELEAPEYRNKYSIGLGYATDTGVRGKVDWSNRLFNSRGHQIRGSFQLAELENFLSLQYDIPRKDPRYYKVVSSLGYLDKTWDDTTTRLLTGSVSQEYSGPRFKFSSGLELRDEVYDVGDTNGDSTLFIPSLNAGVVFADDILFTKNGLQASVGFLGGLEGVISDVSFLQTTVNGKTIVSPFTDWRLIGRGSLGVTLTDSIDALPPSLRFYTGGDNSVRGYRYKSIGPADTSGTVIGGRYLVVGSVELERIVAKNWSLAAFWDAGTATDDLSIDFSQGVGGGVRFRLPFGQVRLDLASAITEDGNPVRVHFTVGGDL